MDNQKTGAYISVLRKGRGMTQKELAEKIGVTDKAVSRWETGRGFPDVSVLKPLSETLGVTIAELVNGEPSAPETASEQADSAILETIGYFRSMARKTVVMLLLAVGVCLASLSLVLTGRSVFYLPVLGICSIAVGIAVLFSKRSFPAFQKSLSPKMARIITLAFLTGAVVLEFLPYGVVMTFADGPDKTFQITTAYFDLLPFGYGNFFPLITAVLTFTVAFGVLASILWKGRLPRLQNAVYLCCILTLGCSAVSLLFGMTFVGTMISVSLLAAVVFQAAANRKTPHMKNM